MRLVLEEYTGPKFELLEEDSIHEATLSNLEVSTFEDPATKEVRKSFNWTFTIHTPGDWEGKRIWGNTSMLFNMHPNCKLRNWAQVLLGEELERDFELDTDDLIGRKCRIIVKHKPYRDKETKEERKKQFVADLMPPRKSSFSRYEEAAPF